MKTYEVWAIKRAFEILKECAKAAASLNLPERFIAPEAEAIRQRILDEAFRNNSQKPEMEYVGRANAVYELLTNTGQAAQTYMRAAENRVKICVVMKFQPNDLDYRVLQIKLRENITDREEIAGPSYQVSRHEIFQILLLIIVGHKTLEAIEIVKSIR